MNTKEVYNELKSRVKPYINIMPQSTFSNTMASIKNETCKPKTMKLFFAKFGYTQNETTWKKQNSNGN